MRKTPPISAAVGRKLGLPGARVTVMAPWAGVVTVGV